MNDDTYRFTSGLDVENAEHRMIAYYDSACRVYETFKKYGLQTFSGAPTDGLRKLAMADLRDVSLSLTTDRAEISDYFAVVPNYHIYLNNEDAHRAWSKAMDKELRRKDDVEDDEPELGPAPNMMVTYSVGMELVIRDFRNYEYLTGVNMSDARNRYLVHPTGQPLPPVPPSEHARNFDVPIGMIYSVDLDPQSMTLSMSAKGFCGEPIKVSVGLRSLLKKLSPVSDAFEWYDEYGNRKDAIRGLQELKRSLTGE